MQGYRGLRTVVFAVFVLVTSVLVTTAAMAASFPFVEDFTGTDGDPWDPTLWTSDVGGAGVIDVQGNQGHVGITTGNGRAVATGMTPTADAEVLVSFRFDETATDAQSFHWLRASGDWADSLNLIPSAGYGVQIKNSSGQVRIFSATGGGSWVILGTNNNAAEVTAATHWLRFQALGSTVRAKVWTEGDPEPLTWELSVVSSTHAGPGLYQVGFSRSGGSTPRNIYFDQLDLHSSGNFPFVDTFDGPDAGPWNTAGWDTATVGDSVIDLQGNRGHVGITTRDGRAIANGMTPTADVDMRISFQFDETSPEAQTFHWLRASGDWADTSDLTPSAGYGVQIKNNSARVKVYLATGAGNRIAIGSVNNVCEVTTATQWVRYQVEGDTIRVKVWTDGTPEPAGWEIEVTDATYAGPGLYQVGFSRSSGSTPRNVFFDDLDIKAPPSP